MYKKLFFFLDMNKNYEGHFEFFIEAGSVETQTSISFKRIKIKNLNKQNSLN